MVRFARLPVLCAILPIAHFSTLAAPPDPVIEAALKSDPAALRSLANRHTDVNVPAPDGDTALHIVAANGDVESAKVLLGAGAHVNAKNRYGVGPLAIACENGDAAMAGLLVEAGADANAAAADGETVLMTAARAGNVSVVNLLLGHDAAVNAHESRRGENALMWAAAEGHTDVVKVLIDRGAHVTESTSKAGFTPSNEGYLPATFLPTGSFTALMFAVRGGYMDSVRALLDAGADPNDTLPNGASALIVAIMNAHYDLSAMLVERGANVNANGQGWTPLHQLIWARDPNRHFNLPPALPNGNMDSLPFANFLLEHGADPNARVTKQPADGFRNWMNRIGATPFILAAKAADTDLMKALVAHGADPSLVSQDHTTALMAAAGIGFWPGESPGTEEDSLAAVKLAFDLGNDVNAANDEGYTAMHGAAVHGGNSVVQFLYDHGAKLEVKTKKEGWLPLTIADGVFIANTYKATPQTAALLRRLMGQSSAAK